MLIRLVNKQRERFDDLDYILFPIDASITALPESRGLLWRLVNFQTPWSLVEIDNAFRRIADDPRPKGVVLLLRGAMPPSADLQTLRNSILRLREKGKRVVCYAQGYDTASYYLASAADEVLLQTGGTLLTLGLRQNILYWKDALERIGVEVESVQVTPFKSAFETLTSSTISPEAEAQVNWLLDSIYNTLVQDIAAGRNLSEDTVRHMIDEGLHTDKAALAAGYVDATLNEEALAEHLGVKHVVAWEQAEKKLYLQWRKPSSRYVALLKINGLIVQGESRSAPGGIPVPVFDDGRAGDVTIVQQVRRLIDDERAAALVVYVDSGGGDAAASEAMTAALEELGKKLPIVAYMHNTAASGGYYVATPARWIVAQPLTITGSIGVVSGKANAGGAYKKLRINPIEYIRGANASLLSDTAPLTEDQRRKLEAVIARAYEQFKERVAASRGMTVEAVDAVGGGRVWTGQQAYAHGLVDELGDLRAALNKARSLAKVPDTTPLVMVKPPRGDAVGPRIVERVNPAAGIRYMLHGIRATYNGRAQLLMPFKLNIKS
ncbi:MAG: S49 family peptidase [Anaerolineae bacterium]